MVQLNTTIKIILIVVVCIWAFAGILRLMYPAIWKYINDSFLIIWNHISPPKETTKQSHYIMPMNDDFDDNRFSKSFSELSRKNSRPVKCEGSLKSAKRQRERGLTNTTLDSGFRASHLSTRTHQSVQSTNSTKSARVIDRRLSNQSVNSHTSNVSGSVAGSVSSRSALSRTQSFKERNQDPNRRRSRRVTGVTGMVGGRGIKVREKSARSSNTSFAYPFKSREEDFTLNPLNQSFENTEVDDLGYSGSVSRSNSDIEAGK
mmetsp:Transcript_13017/g.19634  ORF Transcript_13017/g.19634 Transcript_13017/m.19634 type:complete len:261 (-) Transcript_13017:180-962(-)